MPIDPDFRKKRKKVGKEKEIAVWGPLEPPEKLGIHGTYVAVDWDICTGCSVCLEVCPVQLYEWVETSGHPTSEKKAFPARESDCVQCYTCETKCSVQAIRIVFWPTGFSCSLFILFANNWRHYLWGLVWAFFRPPDTLLCGMGNLTRCLAILLLHSNIL